MYNYGYIKTMIMVIYSANSKICKDAFMKVWLNISLTAIDNSTICKSLIYRKFQAKMQCELLRIIHILPVSSSEEKGSQQHIKYFGGYRNDS
jgi:hypothetical protein